MDTLPYFVETTLPAQAMCSVRQGFKEACKAAQEISFHPLP